MCSWNHAPGQQLKKEKIWLGSVTKAPTPTIKTKKKKQRDNTKNATKNFDYTTITDRRRTVSLSNNSHPTGVVKPGLKGTGLPTYCNSSVIKWTRHDRNRVYNTNTRQVCQDGYFLNVIWNKMKHIITILKYPEY